MFKNTDKKYFFRLILLIRPELFKYFMSLVVVCILDGSLGISIALLFKNAVEAAQNKQPLALGQTVIMLTLLILAMAVLSPFFSYIFIRIVKTTTANIKKRLFDHVQRLPVEIFEKTHSGDLLSILTNDINAMEESYGRGMYSLVQTLFIVVSSISVMIILEWRLALVLVFVVAAFSYINYRLSKKLSSLSDEIQAQTAKRIEKIMDLLNGIFIVKIFNMGSKLKSEFFTQNKVISGLSIKRTDRVALLESANYLVSMMNIAGVVALGAFMVINKTITFGILTAIITLQFDLESAALRIGNIIMTFQNSLSGTKRIFEILDLKQETVQLSKKPLILKDFEIKLTDLSFKYPEGEIALKNLNITFESKKFSAIVGASGSGKSTVAKILLGFHRNIYGNIIIAGNDIAKYSPKQLRTLISYVPQSPYLFEGTIKENIAYGNPFASETSILEASKSSHAHEFITQFPEGYNTKVGELENSLSGGQKQRISIAQAILKTHPFYYLMRQRQLLIRNLNKSLQTQYIIS